jgi:intein/homing endonuclease
LSSTRFGETLGQYEQAEVGGVPVLHELLGAYVGKTSDLQRSFQQWAEGIPTWTGESLDFDLFPFQRELYSKENTYAKEEIEMKATQVGVSEKQVRWSMFMADTRAHTMMYVFPAAQQLRDFCVAADERVLMADGSMKRIQDVRAGDRVLSSDGSRVVTDVVRDSWASGRRPVVKVKLAGGRVLRVTRQHRIYTTRGWVEAGDLTVRDEVAVPRTLPAPETDSGLTPDDAFLLAVWLAEGDKTGGSFGLTNSLPEVRERVCAIAGSRDWKVTICERWKIYLTMKGRRDEATPMAFLRRCGVHGMRTDTVHVPDVVMRSGREAAETFLAAYVACDGSVQPNEITVHSASERMVRDLQVLAARLGIASTIRMTQPNYPGSYPSWALAVAEREARSRIAEIGVPGKPVALPVVLDARRSEQFERATQMRVLAGRGVRQREIATRFEVSEAAVSLTVRGLNNNGQHRRGTRLAVRTDDAVEFGWARVASIEDDGDADTFDLETVEHHAFFLEGALTHNSDQRIKTLIRQSDYLKRRIPRTHIDRNDLKQIGQGFLYARGSRVKAALDSVPADGIVFDEYDDLTPENIPVALKRLSGEKSAGLIRRVGVPTFSDFGIHAEYEKSDMREWHVKCGSCAKELPIHFFQEQDHSAHYVDLEREMRVCGNCETTLKREWIAGGRWIARYPERSVLGYHISRLIVPTAHMSVVCKEFRDAHKQAEIEVFHRSTLGLPYDNDEERLSKEAIAAAISAGGNYMQGPWDHAPAVQEGSLRTAGIDVASARDLNVRISEWINPLTKRALFVGPVEDFNKLTEMMDIYGVNMFCIDHLPDGRLARAFVQRFAGRGYIISWGDKQKDLIKLDTELKQVAVKRTTTISATLAQIRLQRNHLPVDLPSDYVKHLRSAIPYQEEDEKGRVVVGFRKQGDDDYLQAEAYDLVAGEVWYAERGIQEAREEVLQPLDQLMEFRRTSVNQYENTEWSPGISSDEETWARERNSIEADEDDGLPPGEFGDWRSW